jgi:transcriptional regulator with XRE-family HTH domain
LREDRLLTQEELGEAAEVSRDQVSRIERDEVDPRFSTIRKLARALDVDPHELTRGVGDA